MTETTPDLPDSGEGDDQDAGPASTPEELERVEERDQAEGEPDAADE